MMSLTISRIEVSSPPGVSRRIDHELGAVVGGVLERARPIHASVAGSIDPESSIETAGPGARPEPSEAPASTSPAASDEKSASRTPHAVDYR